MNDETLYREYDRAALDAQYDNRAAVPEHVEHHEGWTRDCAAVRSAYADRLDVAYGASAAETLDLFPATGGPAPVQVFFHGGYWLSRDKSDFSFLAPAFVDAGAAMVVVNYALIPAVGMEELVRQCRLSMAWVHGNAASFGGDARRIFVSGHSAGGHLVTMMMATDWPAFADGLPPDSVKGGCAISGIYDLEPIRLTFMQETLGFTPEQVARNSPLGLTPATGAPLIVAVGGDESEEFLRQSETFTAQWAKEGVPCGMMVRPGINHFTILGEFADPESGLTRAVRKQMGLG
mgnify:CR=1 FL=1